MNTKILAQNIVNNPSDFTTAQIEKYFEDYAELRLSAVMQRSEQLISLLEKLLEINMCSHAGDELIEQTLKEINCA